jgi:hypothetical protein
MDGECVEFRKIEDRCRELKRWILANAPQCVTEERHLELNSQEQGYWAHGYLSALLDVLRLFSREMPGQQRDEGDGSPAKRFAA